MDVVRRLTASVAARRWPHSNCIRFLLDSTLERYLLLLGPMHRRAVACIGACVLALGCAAEMLFLNSEWFELWLRKKT